MKKICLILIIIFFTFNLYSVKFFVNTKDQNQITLQALFSFGVSQNGTSDLYGLTEYQSMFFKLGFHVEDFGILLNFNIRFRLFAEYPTLFSKDWFIPNDPLKTFLLYLDKIEYIKYGTVDSPIYFTTGVLPYLTFGSGLIVRDFHNRFFLPVSRENGLYFKFNGNNLNKFKSPNIPLELSFFITDMIDPDLMGLNAGIDIFRFTKISNDFSLKAEYTGIMDLDVNEKNRLSSTDQIIDNGNYRNIISNGYTSCLFLNSLSATFSYTHKYFKIISYNESGFLFDLYNKYNYKFRFGFGNKLGCEARFVYIKDSGFLLGINIAIIGQTTNFIFDFFSSNYEIMRNKQYLKLNDKSQFTINCGFTLYALNDNLRFHLGVTMPLGNEKLLTKFLFKFTLDRLFFKEQKNLPDLYINSVFETGVTEIKISDDQGFGGTNGGYFLTSFTSDFRFFSEIGFRMYGARIGLIIGLQRPASVTPYIDPSDKNKEINMETYAKDLQKFVSLEVAFVL